MQPRAPTAHRSSARERGRASPAPRPTCARWARSNRRAARGWTGSCFGLALARSKCAEAERVQLDEALRILLIVGAAIVLEGDEVLRVERIGRGAARDHHVALVEL